jgi:hypothetical protein
VRDTKLIMKYCARLTFHSPMKTTQTKHMPGRSSSAKTIENLTEAGDVGQYPIRTCEDCLLSLLSPMTPKVSRSRHLTDPIDGKSIPHTFLMVHRAHQVYIEKVMYLPPRYPCRMLLSSAILHMHRNAPEALTPNYGCAIT